MSLLVWAFFPPLVPRTRGPLDGPAGEWPVWTCPDVEAPAAAPSCSRNGDVGGGGTSSSSATPPRCWTYTGANVELGSGSTTDGELPTIGSAAESGTSALVS